ncbi:unnamed protein product [Symbiodinium sp. CCMP2592]|nr:unnamed protein product [Symbiodinium sp. CCMP2592]
MAVATTDQHEFEGTFFRYASHALTLKYVRLFLRKGGCYKEAAYLDTECSIEPEVIDHVRFIGQVRTGACLRAVGSMLPDPEVGYALSTTACQASQTALSEVTQREWWKLRLLGLPWALCFALVSRRPPRTFGFTVQSMQCLSLLMAWDGPSHDPNRTPGLYTTFVGTAYS